jgi:DNA polymerase V
LGGGDGDISEIVSMATFALVDINNFYVSCERVFDPKINRKPTVCLSNNDSCCISRSNEAKNPPYNIKMGEPYFKLKEKFKPSEVVFLSSNYCLYADMSNRVVQVVSRFSPDYEVYSVDESFLRWTGFEHLDLTQYGHQLKATILQWTGLPVCVGIASTKTLAKLSNHCAKKRPEYDGVCNFKAMTSKEVDETMASFPVGEVWGIGRQLSAKLNQMNIHTVLDLKKAHRRTMRDKFSVTMEKVVTELNGEPCIELEQIPPDKQNIASTRSFGIPVTDLASLKESVTLYTSQAAEKARKQASYANSITVFIQTSPFANRPYYGNSQTVALPSPSNDTRLLVRTALWILGRLYRPGYVYQKAGVLLNGLVPAAGVQQDLFFGDGINTTKSQKLMSALDSVNQRYGRQTLKLGSEGFNAPWQMKQDFKSPDYTCDWEGLIRAY